MNSIQDPLPRKHVPSEKYHLGYGQQFSLFAPLGAQEESDLSAGQNIFQSKHPETLLFPEPFLGRRTAFAATPMTNTRVVAGRSATMQRAARELAARIGKACGGTIEVVDDADPGNLLRTDQALVILGGGHENACALEIARRYQLGLFSSEFPGQGGWGITTLTELEAGMPPRFILGCDESSAPDAIAAFMQKAPAVGDPNQWGWVHEIHPGPDHPFHAADLRSFLRSQAIAEWFPVLRRWADGEDSRPYREVFRDFLVGQEQEHPDARDEKPFGLPYNAIAIDIGINAIRFYQATGCIGACEVFREMLWGYWLYLRTPDPSIYVSDMDFRLGKLCAYWGWIEHAPIVTDQERQIFPLLLLGLARMVRDYYRQNWKSRELGSPQRREAHNHQTFKCSGLAQAWRYFARWNPADRASWKEEADALFAPLDPAAFKHLENAGNYETFVPEHTLVWMENTGVPVPDAMREALALFAWREWVTRDNFLYALDYGDSDPYLHVSMPFGVSAWIGEGTPLQRQIRNLEKSCSGLFAWSLINPVRNFTGVDTAEPGQPFAAPHGWQLMPLDPGFGGNLDLRGTPAQRFDKLAWRSGWQPESSYLCLEGIGNQTVSHAHNETNGILRMNFAGRIWAVSNGYGKRAGIADASKAFRTRQLGPEEHNMLVVRQPDAKPALPPINALLLDRQTEPLPLSASLLRGYAGVDWLRVVVTLGNSGFLVLDRVRAVEAGGPLPEFELQWNLLGCRSEIADGDSILDQNGCRAVVCHFGSAAPEWKPSPVAVWNKLVKSGAYRHTKCLPHQCILRPPSMSESASRHCFLTGFWVEGAVQDPSWDAAQSRLSLRLQGDRVAADARSEETWGWIELRAGQLELQLNETLNLA